MLKLYVNYLLIIKIRLAVGLDAKFVNFIEEINIFQSKDKSETFDIRKGILNCSTNLVVYLIECKSCPKQYVGSTIPSFHSRFNN